MWLATDEDSAQVMVAGSRGRRCPARTLSVLSAAAGHRRLPALQKFGTLQRCWTHINRESKNHVRIAEMRSGISSTDCRDAQARHDGLLLVYHPAKEMGSATPGWCEVLVQRTIQMARTYPEKLGNKIVSAAPYPFAFLLHLNMQPTNNHSEKELRPIVMRRMVSGQIGSVEGMRRFIHACGPGASEISTSTASWTIP